MTVDEEKMAKGLNAIIFIAVMFTTFGVLWWLRSIGVIKLW